MSSVSSMQVTVKTEEPSTISVHQGRKKSKWKCLNCHRHFCKKYVLENHGKKCSEKVHYSPVDVSHVKQNGRLAACPMCQKWFSNKSNLVNHIKNYHSSIDVNTICPRRRKTTASCPGELTFEITVYLSYHTIHTVVKIYKMHNLHST